MGMKFLNKKGWHTGSLRNIENVWKAEQKNDAELKKLEELRKQILEERVKSEFRLLQEQAGLVPKQERLDFLYDSGLAVGKGSSDGFKELQSLPKNPEPEIPSASGSASANVSAAPGALFEDKPQSANDSWRKLHSDPLLMIRQREQEALARVRNNPVQMAMIHKSIVEKKPKKKGDKKKSEKKESKKHRDKSSKHKRHISPSDSENDALERKRNRKGSDGNHPESSYRNSSPSDSENDALERKRNRKAGDHNRPESDDYSKRKHDSEDDFADRSLRKNNHNGSDSRYNDNRSHDYRKRDTSRSDVHYKPRDSERAKHDRYSSYDDQTRLRADDHFSKSRRDSEELVKREGHRKNRDDIAESDTVRSDGQHRPRDSEKSKHDRYSKDVRTNSTSSSRYRVGSSSDAARYDAQHSRRSAAHKISEEERAARLEAMQKDAELHEEQRWKRIKKADEEDAREAALKSTSTGKNFLDAAKTSVYGAAEKGNFTIEESVRRRAHYLQGHSEANSGSAFRR